jgi:hypothetical protein
MLVRQNDWRGIDIPSHWRIGSNRFVLYDSTSQHAGSQTRPTPRAFDSPTVTPVYLIKICFARDF